MAVNVKNAFIAKPMDAGTAFAYPSGKYPMPTDAMTPLDPQILACDHGAVDEDGYAVSPNRTNAKFPMFGGGTFATAQTEYEETVKITFLEDGNINVLETVFGEANVLTEEATDEHGSRVTVYHTADELPLQTWVVQSIYEGQVNRRVIEFARVASVGEVKSSHKEPTKWEITLDVLEGSNGRYVNEYRERDDKLVEVQYTVTVDGTGGDYTLKVGSAETEELDHDITGPAMKSALEDLDTVVKATVTLLSGVYTVKLVAHGGLSVGADNLTGPDAGVVVVAA